MAVLRRKSEDEVVTRDRDRAEERSERSGTSPGLVRALFTLLGVAAAGFLLWLASAVAFPLDEASTTEYWIAMALIAGAGLALGLSQLFGGWTKWGWPTLSPTVFLLGFLPTLVVGGWILLAKQPQDGVQEGRFDRWSSDLGISGLVDDLAFYLPAIPLVIGLVLAFSFDTTGPRTRIVTRDRAFPDDDRRDLDSERTAVAPVATRTEAGTTDTRMTDVETSEPRTDTSVADELRERELRSDTADTRTDTSVADEFDRELRDRELRSDAPETRTDTSVAEELRDREPRSDTTGADTATGARAAPPDSDRDRT